MIASPYFLLKRLSVLLLAALALGAAPLPSYAAGDKPAKASKGKKKKKKKKGDKDKKGKKKASDSKKRAKKENRDTEHFLIAEGAAVSPLDRVYNRCMRNVLDGKYGPEDERVCGKSLLWYAAGKGMLPAVQYLIGKGADTRACADEYQTIVSQAVRSGNLELLKYLKESKITRQLKKNQSIVVEECAALSGNVEMLKAAREVLGNYEPPAGIGYRQAIRSGNVEMLKQIVPAGQAVEAAKAVNLACAAQSGNMQMLKEMEKMYPGASLVDVDSKKATLLMHAARSGNLEMVKYAESKGIDPKSVSDWKDTAIIFAAASGSLECVKYLVEEKKLDVFAESLRFGNSYIHAGLSGCAGLVEYMVSKNKEHAGAALLGAAYNGDLDMARMLVEKYQADVNSWGALTVTDMMHFGYDASMIKRLNLNVLAAAVYSGSLELVQYLLDKGADVNNTRPASSDRFRNESNNPALWSAAAGGQPEIMRLLAKNGANLTPVRNPLLRDAAMCGNLGCLKYLIEEVGADADADTYCTPLQAACMFNQYVRGMRWSYDTGSNHLACVQYLLANGADTGKISEHTKSKPIDIATFFEQPEIVIALVEARADCSSVISSPMALAGRNGRLDCLQKLVNLGLDVDSSGSDGHTALDEVLIWAAPDPFGCYYECAEFLLNKNAQVKKGKISKYVPESIRKLVESKQ